jgi:SAM-dependent methyltransferase
MQARMPFADDTFDVVGCRLAIHHFGSPAEQVREMARVTRPGGYVVLVDLVASDDGDEAAEHNRLERLRDPSHTVALSVGGLIGLISGPGGLVPTCAAAADVPQLVTAMDLDGWLAATATPGDSEFCHLPNPPLIRLGLYLWLLQAD